MRILFGFVLMLFVDSVMKAYKIQNEEHHHHDHNILNDGLQKAKLFHAQRNSLKNIN
jgi:hypothetical protein